MRRLAFQIALGRGLGLAAAVAVHVAAGPLAAQAPSPDTTGLIRSVSLAREALRGLPGLWEIDGSRVEWILTDGRTHFATGRGVGGGASGADASAGGAAAERLTPIALPAGTTIANTAVEVQGRRWAMVVLPLGRTDLARTRLLVHEAMHTFQPERLPRPARTEAGEGGDFLDGEQGRLWLFLELRAIAAALTSSGEALRDAARDAILFRAQRHALAHPTERARLDALDLAEGIPEYTGWRLAGASDSLLAARLRAADTMRVSWVRGVGYWTGPAYGFLLDRLGASGWRAEQQRGERLPVLLARAVGSGRSAAAAAESSDATADDPSYTALVEARAASYGGVELARVEHARAVANARRLDSLRTRFVAGPVLRVIPASLRISFDPNGQTPLAGDGTVMLNFRWAAEDGAELVAAGGALVSPDWSWVQVPLGAVEVTERNIESPRTITGDGWRLTLPAGWRVQRVDGRVELRPPR
jgi:hypothetical protein